jgi:hypothetical protein
VAGPAEGEEDVVDAAYRVVEDEMDVDGEGRWAEAFEEAEGCGM